MVHGAFAERGVGEAAWMDEHDTLSASEPTELRRLF